MWGPPARLLRGIHVRSAATVDAYCRRCDRHSARAAPPPGPRCRSDGPVQGLQRRPAGLPRQPGGGTPPASTSEPPCSAAWLWSWAPCSCRECGESGALSPRQSAVHDSGRDMRCSRFSKSTHAQCRRDAAEWPSLDNLPAPVVACAGHLSPSEWVACQEARRQYHRLAAERLRREAAERDHLRIPSPPAGEVLSSRPCIGKCTSKLKACGDDRDGALSECAHCDGFVCLNCGVKRVDDDFGWCDACDQLQPDDADYDPVTPQGDGTYGGLFPNGGSPQPWPGSLPQRGAPTAASTSPSTSSLV